MPPLSPLPCATRRAENFRLVAADVQPDGLPDLADAEAQRFYEAAIADAELIIVDNLSTIARGLRENEADAFGPVQSWLLAQRAAGRSVLLIHHAGKGGGQRGTSRKEDVLDTVISLSRPPGYSASEGARFEVRFTKSRGFWGRDAEPFEARYCRRPMDNGGHRRRRQRRSLGGLAGGRALHPGHRRAHRPVQVRSRSAAQGGRGNERARTRAQAPGAVPRDCP